MDKISENNLRDCLEIQRATASGIQPFTSAEISAAVRAAEANTGLRHIHAVGTPKQCKWALFARFTGPNFVHLPHATPECLPPQRLASVLADLGPARLVTSGIDPWPGAHNIDVS